MNQEKLIYLVNEQEVERKDFYHYLELCSTKLSHCCVYEIEAEQKELKRIKRELLYGLIKKISGVKFQIKRICNSEVKQNEKHNTLY